MHELALQENGGMGARCAQADLLLRASQLTGVLLELFGPSFPYFPAPKVVTSSPSPGLPLSRRAYGALSWGSDCDELRRGLDLAKKVQQALVNGAGRAGRLPYGSDRCTLLCRASFLALPHPAPPTPPSAL